MAVQSWEDAKKQAQRVLGASGEMPELPQSLERAGNAYSSAQEDFESSRADCLAKLRALADANREMLGGMKQLESIIGSHDFELDPKNKDEKKKIDQARKILLGQVDQAQRQWGDQAKMYGTMLKYLTDMRSARG